MIEAVTAERLARLRVLLAGALAASTDQTATGRHVSVIFLDGVTELALHLAADEHGVDVLPKHGLEQVYGMVAQELGPTWDRTGWKGVRELHRTRNNLQHHGVLPDAQHVPIWASEVDRFVHRLVAAAFSKDLAAVRAADAVEDQDLRQRLVAAERALDGEDFSAALKEAKDAVDVAIGRFRSLTGNSSRSFSSGLDKWQEFRKIDQSMASLESFVDVAYLATDPGEWLWLKKFNNLVRGGADVSRDQAQRAYNFALSWILRFEAFDARFPRRQEPEYVEPSLDETYVAPRIVAATVDEHEGFDGSVVVRLELDEIPPDWLRNIPIAVRSLQKAGQSPPGLMAQSHGAGIVLRLPDESDVQRIRPLAEELIDACHRVFEAQLAERRKDRDAEEHRAARYRDALHEDERVTQVTSEGWAGTSSSIVRISIGVPHTAHLEPLIEEALNAARPTGERVHIGFRQGVMSFREDQYGPDEILPAFEEALAIARRRAEEQAEAKRGADERHRHLVDGARDAFADVADQGPSSNLPEGEQG